MATYAPRIADGTVLHGIVRDHLETFLAEAAARTDGVGLPGFVEREFRGFLRCGLLVHGFTRVRCDDCAFERLVPFSCKARAICPSCGGRRMAEQAAHLVEAVLPSVPVRQWVLTVPHRLRYRLAFDHVLCRAVLGVFARAVLGWYRRRARHAGVTDGQSGTVTVVQRFGSGLELNKDLIDQLWAHRPLQQQAGHHADRTPLYKPRQHLLECHHPTSHPTVGEYRPRAGP